MDESQKPPPRRIGKAATFAAGLAIGAAGTAAILRTPPASAPARPDSAAQVAGSTDAPQYLSVDAAVDEYKKMEKSIVSALEQARARGRTLKILYGDVHNSANAYLAMIMIQDIARKHGVTNVSLEAPEALIKQELQKMNAFSSDSFTQFNYAGMENLQNMLYFTNSVNRKNPGLPAVSIRGIDDSKTNAQALEIIKNRDIITADELKQPALWIEKYKKLSVELQKQDAIREPVMAGHIKGLSADEVVVSGKYHLQGIAKNLQTQPDLDILAFYTDPDGQDASRLAKKNLDTIVGRINPFAYNSSPPKIEASKDVFYDTVLPFLTDGSTVGNDQMAADFCKNNATQVVSQPLPPERNSQRGALEMLRDVKKRLGDKQIVALPPAQSTIAIS